MFSSPPRVCHERPHSCIRPSPRQPPRSFFVEPYRRHSPSPSSSPMTDPPPPPMPISILAALRPLFPSRCPPSLLPVHSHAIHHHRRNHRAARYNSHRNPRSRLFDDPLAPSPPRRVPSSLLSPQPHDIFIACRAAPWKSASTSSPNTASSPDCCPAVRRLDLLWAAPWKSASTAPQPSHLHV